MTAVFFLPGPRRVRLAIASVFAALGAILGGRWLAIGPDPRHEFVLFATGCILVAVVSAVLALKPDRDAPA
jgi:hypothetical protein